MEKITIVTCNIGRGESPGSAESNMRRVRQGFAVKPVVGWQEIDEADTPDEHGILQQVFPSPAFSQAGWTQREPISIPNMFNVVRTAVTKACDGRPKVTPQRSVIQAVIEVGVLPRIVLMNGHYPFNAPDLRRECNRVWTQLAHQWHEAGYTVITTRDTNWHGKMPKLHPKERLITQVGAIDRITVIENSVTARVSKRHVVNLNIDGHNAVGVTLNLKEK